jgi:hypothetical protein
MLRHRRSGITLFSANRRQFPVNDHPTSENYRPLAKFGRPPYTSGLMFNSQYDVGNHTMEQAQLIQAAASIAGGMAAAHYDKFSGLVASRVTEIAETAVRIARAIEIEARKLG